MWVHQSWGGAEKISTRFPRDNDAASHWTTFWVARVYMAQAKGLGIKPESPEEFIKIWRAGSTLRISGSVSLGWAWECAFLTYSQVRLLLLVG